MPNGVWTAADARISFTCKQCTDRSRSAGSDRSVRVKEAVT
jgi:hypothetical protein